MASRAPHPRFLTVHLMAWANFAGFTDDNWARLDDIDSTHVLEQCPFVDAVMGRADIASGLRPCLSHETAARVWREADDWDVPYDATVHRGSYLNGDYYEPIECAKHGEMAWR